MGLSSTACPWREVRAQRPSARFAAVALSIAIGAASGAAHATEETAPVDAVEESAHGEHRLRWEPYTHFRPVQYAVTFGAPVLFRIIDRNTEEAEQARWRGPVLFDAPVRDLLRVGPGSQRAVVRVSTYGWYGAMAWPFVDAVVVALAVDQNPDVAWQLSALALQAYALSGFVTLLSIKAAARERPASSGCSEGSTEPNCSLPPRGFPSGHTAGAFAGAGLVCASHLNLPLYASAFADRAACAGALTVASATAVLRVSADRHYASDVIVGGAIGTTVGYVLPLVFQYTRREPGDAGLAILPGPDGGYALTYGRQF